MLAQGTASLPYPSRLVASVLASQGDAWSVALDGDGEHTLAEVGVRVGNVPVYKRVRLRIGVFSGTLPTDWLMLPVSWETVGGPPIFPSMEGTVHVQADGPATTRLTLNARYDPPLGKLGTLIDRIAMHRVAEVTMKDFIERLAETLSAEIEGSTKPAN
jgi:hypothetical protein